MYLLSGSPWFGGNKHLAWRQGSLVAFSHKRSSAPYCWIFQNAFLRWESSKEFCARAVSPSSASKLERKSLKAIVEQSTAKLTTKMARRNNSILSVSREEESVLNWPKSSLRHAVMEHVRRWAAICSRRPGYSIHGRAACLYCFRACAVQERPAPVTFACSSDAALLFFPALRIISNSVT